jgi:hypothetical protein
MADERTLKPVYFLVPAAILALAVGSVLATRMLTTGEHSSEGPTPPHRDEVSSDTIRDNLRRAIDLDDYRSLVQLLNTYVEQGGAKCQRTLASADRDLLGRQFHLEPDELAEIDRPNFTTLDAHHLEFSFLLRDALRSLHTERLSPLDQATASFAWVMRQIRQVDRTGDSVPPEFVLRRGSGTAQERALVFLALLEQLGIDSCMVAIPGGARGDAGLRYWVAGALIGKSIYLFDTRLGLPLPGSKGQGVATLAQVRQDPSVLQQLMVDPKLPYDVTTEQARQTELQIACSLSALAPRLRLLEEALSGSDTMHLSVDARGLWQRFEAACKEPGLSGTRLRVWNLPGDPNTPIRVLRGFLPPQEGGTDKTQREELSKRELVPWSAYPRPLLQIRGPVGDATAGLFRMPFISFSLDTKLSNQLLQLWMPALAQASSGGNGGGAGMSRRPSDVLVRERMPRDLVLRGRLEEATPLLVAMRAELQHQKTLVNQVADLQPQLEEWCERAKVVSQTRLVVQERARRAKNPEEAASEMAAADEQLNQLNKSFPVSVVIQAAAAEPMSDAVTYLLALCKHEQAERVQTRVAASAKGAENAWRSAVDWWSNYLSDFPRGSGMPAARGHLARAKLALEQRAEAAALLVDVTEQPLTNLEKTGRLYLARQIGNK